MGDSVEFYEETLQHPSDRTGARERRQLVGRIARWTTQTGRLTRARLISAHSTGFAVATCLVVARVTLSCTFTKLTSDVLIGL